MAQGDAPAAAPEAVVRAALGAYLKGAVSLVELLDWLGSTCGGRRAATAPELVGHILGVVETHLALIRADLGVLAARNPPAG